MKIKLFQEIPVIDFHTVEFKFTNFWRKKILKLITNAKEG